MVWFGKGVTDTSHGRISPVQFMILLMAERKKEAYGYELLQELSEIFNGIWKPKSGTVYPALNSLEERGFLTSEKVEQEDRPDKRIYKITEKGREVLGELIDSFEEEVEFGVEFGAKMFEYIGSKLGTMFWKKLFPENMSELHHLKEKKREFREKMREKHWEHHGGPWKIPWMMPWMKYLFFGDSFPNDDRKELLRPYKAQMLKQYKARLQEELEMINNELEKLEKIDKEKEQG
jgi:DNA-binding PadR family transcriptional regulator